ncbi:MAG: hypothetical protein HOL56_02710 [Flavobacteriales bacterium]|jgi:hypothetical protein|nr:hypothetical protein [Flavobacteriales bacterium]MBT5699733.1 hypothetical protein [Flavobacteriales bacterium]MBT7619705.1 hypothetical protein [Flavobacteriales bacterium]
MKKLIKRGMLFLMITAIVSIALGLLSVFISKKTFDYKFKEKKNILIVGNSHTECSVNDSIISNSVNLSQSASSYFYSYMKIREFTKYNSQIDTVIISFSDNDLFSEKEKWFSSSDKINNKMTRHIILFNKDDYLDLFKSNPIEVIVQTFILYSDFYNLHTQKRDFIGSYNKINVNEIDEDIIEFNLSSPVVDERIAITELQYLLKIYEFTQENKIKLILLNTPIHPILEKHFLVIKPRNLQIVSENMPNATYFDHTSFVLKNSDYADLSHLNNKGSNKYSEFLQLLFRK